MKKTIPEFSASFITLTELTIPVVSVVSEYAFTRSQVSNFEIKADFDIAMDPAGKQIKAVLTLDIETRSEADEQKEATGKFEFVYIYHVEHLEKFTQKSKGKAYKMRPVLANSIAAITYSTTRGALFQLVKGTALENFILPVIDPNELLKKFGFTQ
ncbi:MAG: hypothetical protein MUC87_13040 [Bacteroidia bacterium]|jgi:hypothetical protein|nr:hypothetical protein [Bacteroidia bacterium]